MAAMRPFVCASGERPGRARQVHTLVFGRGAVTRMQSSAICGYEQVLDSNSAQQ